MRITCSKPFLLCSVLLLLLDERGFYLLVFGGILIHEAGHLLAMLLLRCRVESLQLRVSGLCLDYTEGHLSYGRDALIAIAGPLANLLAASILWALKDATWGEKGYLAIGVQVLLAGFNLLPAMPMDGGRVLLAMLSKYWGPEQGERVLQFVSAIVSAILLGLGLHACRNQWHNPTLLITAMILLFGLLKRKN